MGFTQKQEWIPKFKLVIRPVHRGYVPAKSEIANTKTTVLSPNHARNSHFPFLLTVFSYFLVLELSNHDY